MKTEQRLITQVLPDLFPESTWHCFLKLCQDEVSFHSPDYDWNAGAELEPLRALVAEQKCIALSASIWEDFDPTQRKRPEIQYVGFALLLKKGVRLPRNWKLGEVLSDPSSNITFANELLLIVDRHYRRRRVGKELWRHVLGLIHGKDISPIDMYLPDGSPENGMFATDAKFLKRDDQRVMAGLLFSHYHLAKH